MRSIVNWFNFFAKTPRLVSQVGEVKHEKGLPIYAPDRELAMLQARREEAAKAGISPQLIEDVLRRFMRESYSNENQFGFKTWIQPLTRLLLLAVTEKWGNYLPAIYVPLVILFLF